MVSSGREGNFESLPRDRLLSLAAEAAKKFSRAVLNMFFGFCEDDCVCVVNVERKLESAGNYGENANKFWWLTS